MSRQTAEIKEYTIKKKNSYAQRLLTAHEDMREGDTKALRMFDAVIQILKKYSAGATESQCRNGDASLFLEMADYLNEARRSGASKLIQAQRDTKFMPHVLAGLRKLVLIRDCNVSENEMPDSYLPVLALNGPPEVDAVVAYFRQYFGRNFINDVDGESLDWLINRNRHGAEPIAEDVSAEQGQGPGADSGLEQQPESDVVQQFEVKVGSYAQRRLNAHLNILEGDHKALRILEDVIQATEKYVEEVPENQRDIGLVSFFWIAKMGKAFKDAIDVEDIEAIFRIQQQTGYLPYILAGLKKLVLLCECGIPESDIPNSMLQILALRGPIEVDRIVDYFSHYFGSAFLGSFDQECLNRLREGSQPEVGESPERVAVLFLSAQTSEETFWKFALDKIKFQTLNDRVCIDVNSLDTDKVKSLVMHCRARLFNVTLYNSHGAVPEELTEFVKDIYHAEVVNKYFNGCNGFLYTRLYSREAFRSTVRLRLFIPVPDSEPEPDPPAWICFYCVCCLPCYATNNVVGGFFACLAGAVGLSRDICCPRTVMHI